eukprot:m51a1_g8780 hypothetical protein (257) ;mRNA; f:186888-187892
MWDGRWRGLCHMESKGFCALCANSSSEAAPANCSICGNGRVDPGEQCDGTAHCSRCKCINSKATGGECMPIPTFGSFSEAIDGAANDKMIGYDEAVDLVRGLETACLAWQRLRASNVMLRTSSGTRYGSMTVDFQVEEPNGTLGPDARLPTVLLREVFDEAKSVEGVVAASGLPISDPRGYEVCVDDQQAASFEEGFVGREVARAAGIPRDAGIVLSDPQAHKEAVWPQEYLDAAPQALPTAAVSLAALVSVLLLA